MTTFDGWEDLLYGTGSDDESYLEHYRTKDSKNGVRRYQTVSGEWTPLGLRRRREREGWGDKEERQMRKAERRAAKAERKAAKRADKAKRKAEKDSRRLERAAALKEHQMRTGRVNLKNLSDKEMESLLKRAKMEQEYREITKSPLLKFGETAVTKFFDNKLAKEQRMAEREKNNYEMLKLQEQTKQKTIDKDSAVAKANAEKAKAESETKKAEADLADIKAGTRKKSLAVKMKEAKAKMKAEKTKAMDKTITGGIRKAINEALVGQSRANSKYKEAMAEVNAEKKKNNEANRAIRKKGEAEATTIRRKSEEESAAIRRKSKAEGEGIRTRTKAMADAQTLASRQDAKDRDWLDNWEHERRKRNSGWNKSK